MEADSAGSTLTPLQSMTYDYTLSLRYDLQHQGRRYAGREAKGAQPYGQYNFKRLFGDVVQCASLLRVLLVLHVVKLPSAWIAARSSASTGSMGDFGDFGRGVSHKVYSLSLVGTFGESPPWKSPKSPRRRMK